MSLTFEQAAEKAVASLSSDERDGTVVYLDPRPVEAGSPVAIDERIVDAPCDCLVAFVDLQPAANWGHRCRYLLICTADGGMETVDASLPPFLRQPVKDLRVVWKGSNVPDWTVSVGH